MYKSVEVNIMDFVKIGDKYYNKNAILCVYMCDSANGKGEYILNFVGGKTINISEEEYNNILDQKKKRKLHE